MPPTALATTGVPQARASVIVSPQTSSPGRRDIEVGSRVKTGDFLGVLQIQYFANFLLPVIPPDITSPSFP